MTKRMTKAQRAQVVELLRCAADCGLLAAADVYPCRDLPAHWAAWEAKRSVQQGRVFNVDSDKYRYLLLARRGREAGNENVALRPALGAGPITAAERLDARPVPRPRPPRRPRLRPHQGAAVRCKHRCPYDVSSVDILNEPEPRTSLLGQRRCMDCGEVVPYGPSYDGGEHAARVAVEVRGTALADNWREQSYRPGCDRLEWCPETKSDELCDLCQAHVLAHAIATHEASDE